MVITENRSSLLIKNNNNVNIEAINAANEEYLLTLATDNHVNIKNTP